MLFHVVNDRHRKKRAMIFYHQQDTHGVGPRPIQCEQSAALEDAIENGVGLLGSLRLP